MSNVVREISDSAVISTCSAVRVVFVEKSSDLTDTSELLNRRVLNKRNYLANLMLLQTLCVFVKRPMLILGS